MNCEDYEALLSEYSRGGLEPRARDELAAHLRQCSGCAEALAMLDALDAFAAAEPAPSPRLVTEFHARLARELRNRAEEPRRLAGFFAALWPSRPAGAFGYSLTLLVCGMLGGQLLPPQSFGFGSPLVADQGADARVQMCAIQNPQVDDIL